MAGSATSVGAVSFDRGRGKGGHGRLCLRQTVYDAQESQKKLLLAFVVARIALHAGSRLPLITDVEKKATR